MDGKEVILGTGASLTVLLGFALIKLRRIKDRLRKTILQRISNER